MHLSNVTGWPAVSVPALAKASGLVLEKQKDGAVTRYFGRAAEQLPAA